MSAVLRIQSVLALQPNKKMLGLRLGERTGFTPLELSRHTSQMVKTGAIYRTYRPNDTSPWFHMDDDQVRHFRARVEPLRKALADHKLTVTLPVAPAEIARRMSFLHMLQERTLFRDDPTLALIRADYEASLRIAAAAEEV